MIYLLFILLFYFNRCKEGITNKPIDKHILLIGDSVLNNANYVSYTTFDHLQKLIGKENVLHNYAKDGATITDCFKQVDKIPILNNDTFKNGLCIVVSCGGNDILQLSNTNTKNVQPSINKLSLLIETIKTKFPLSNIYLLNVYYSFSSKYVIYKPVIETWNKSLLQLINNKSNNNCRLVDVASVIIEPSDLIYDIEPSESGGRKVAICISNSL